MLVEAEIGDELLQLAVLVNELLQPPQLAHTQPAVQLIPAVERLLADAHPAQNFGHRRSRFSLLRRERNLLLSVPRLLHGSISSKGSQDAGKLTFWMEENPGGTSNNDHDRRRRQRAQKKAADLKPALPLSNH